ncbi:MAG: DNA-3-methyladenine glycosylase [Calditrichia bacterium]
MKKLAPEEIDFSDKLATEFYSRPTRLVARDLLGKVLIRCVNNEFLGGMIVETEAYLGEADAASHAARGITPRNRVMYGPPGTAYIYFIYGMYNCLNFVTEPEGHPAAVLIRALEPLFGIQMMQKLRAVASVRQLTSGPGKLCQALAINRTLNNEDLTGENLFVVHGAKISPKQIEKSARLGIKVATEFHWRYYIKDNPHVSGKPVKK